MWIRPVIALCSISFLAACSHEAPPAADATAATAAPAASAPAQITSIPASVRAAVDAPDRTADDRALDAGRKPDQMLAFFGIAPGMKVAEIGAGGGYTSELLARAVGPTGKVYAQNSPFILEKFAQVPWTARLSKPVMANVVRADREFDDPLPPEAADLDAVLIVLFYHDTVHLGADRNKLNQAIFKALKPGGVYGIVDHSAPAGSGLRDVKTTHRIDEKTLIAEVEQNGFKLDAEADFLRNPSDTRDWNDSPREAGDKRGTSDRFVLRFKKP